MRCWGASIWVCRAPTRSSRAGLELEPGKLSCWSRHQWEMQGGSLVLIARLETLNGCSRHIRSNSVKLSRVVINVHPFPADGPGRHIHKPIPTSTIPPLSVPETTASLCFVVASIIPADLAVLKAVLLSSQPPTNYADLCWKRPHD